MKACTCGNPATLDVIHRKDGPCIAAAASSLNETITLLEESADEILALKARLKLLEDEERGWAHLNATLQVTITSQQDIIKSQAHTIERLRKPPQ